MWNRIKRWFGSNDDSQGASKGIPEYKFKWYDPGGDNPFPVRILDVRDLTLSLIATTSDFKIVESFNTQRRSNGREYIDAAIENSTTVDCNLTFPHNGDQLEGIVFKSDSMDVKWDIYIYNSAFLFVRSWTGQLQYRAFAEITDTAIRILRIETSSDLIEIAPQAVYFLLGTHAMGRVLPHTIPRNIPDDPQQIGLLSFSMYGNRGCYATYDDITQIEIPQTEGRIVNEALQSVAPETWAARELNSTSFAEPVEQWRRQSTSVTSTDVTWACRALNEFQLAFAPPRRLALVVQVS